MENEAESIPSDLITAKDAARLVKVDLCSVHRWIQAGKLRAWKLVGRMRVSRSEVLALLQPVLPVPAEKRQRRRAQPSPAAVAARQAWLEREADRLGL